MVCFNKNAIHLKLKYPDCQLCLFFNMRTTVLELKHIRKNLLSIFGNLLKVLVGCQSEHVAQTVLYLQLKNMSLKEALAAKDVSIGTVV